MGASSWQVLLLSDGNAKTLAGCLNNTVGRYRVHAVAGPFGEVLVPLLDKKHPLWAQSYQAVVIWTRPEGVVPSFMDRLNGIEVDDGQVLKEVDSFCDAVLSLTPRVRAVLVPSWVLAPYVRSASEASLRPQGVVPLLWQMNLRLVNRLADNQGVYVLHATEWIEEIGEDAFNPKYWYMAKLAFSSPVFHLAAQHLRQFFDLLQGDRKKLLVLDLDDVLWGGIVGDIGWEHLVLGGHDPIGEAFVDFQRSLKRLREQGILLAIASRNEEATALEAIRRHPEMQLRLEDFVAWRINWEDKAANIVSLAEELNIGLDSVVFIDDSPFERERVASALSEVFVPDWPPDKMLYAKALRQMRCFDRLLETPEDRARTEMYRSERKRQAVRREMRSVEAWLAGLELQVEIEPVSPGNFVRVLQLLNKTNQMNLSTRRLTDVTLKAWHQERPEREMWAFRARDRFGDSGLVGVASAECINGTCRVVDFVLSCRVFGREIEKIMLQTIVRYATGANCRHVLLTYRPTAKNKPCLRFLQQAGLETSHPDYTWDTSKPYPVPNFITVRMGSG